MRLLATCSPTRRLMVAMVATMLVTVAACGGESDQRATDDTGDVLRELELELEDPSDGGLDRGAVGGATSTTAPLTDEQLTFCRGFAEADERMTELSFGMDPNDPESQLEFHAASMRELEGLASIAPPELAEAMQTIIIASETVDPTEPFPELEPELQAAVTELEAYFASVCGAPFGP